MQKRVIAVHLLLLIATFFLNFHESIQGRMHSSRGYKHEDYEPGTYVDVYFGKLSDDKRKYFNFGSDHY